MAPTAGRQPDLPGLELEAARGPYWTQAVMMSTWMLPRVAREYGHRW
jgi:hypothetical protein